jgi:SPOR domain
MLGDTDTLNEDAGKEYPALPRATAQPLPAYDPFEPDFFPERDEPRGNAPSGAESEGDKLAYASGYLATMKPKPRRVGPLAIAALVGIVAIGAVTVALVRSGGTGAPPPVTSANVLPIKADVPPTNLASGNAAVSNPETPPPALAPKRVDPAATLPTPPPVVQNGGAIVRAPVAAAPRIANPSIANPPEHLAATVSVLPPPVETEQKPVLPKVAKATDSGVATTSGVLVQVSSMRSERNALAQFRALQQRHPQLLGDRDPIVQRADLGERGIYYRVRVSYPTWRQAASMCDYLKIAGSDCLIVSR